MSSQNVTQNPTSRLIYGCMGLGDGWDDSPITAEHIQQAHQVIDTAIESGITVFDHADIYTRGKAEKVFGIALKDRPELAEQLTIQSKCGIRFADDTGPGRYDFSKTHILSMVDGILERLGIEQIDTLLLHRPDPLMVPEEVAEAVETLQQSGKIRQLGVSNMNLHQMVLLQSALSTPIVCNQLELSLTKLDWLEEGVTSHASTTLGTIEYCRSNNIELQAWGSLSQGLFTRRDISNQPEAVKNTAATVAELAAKYQVSTEAIVLGWLLRHPAKIAPVIGSHEELISFFKMDKCSLQSGVLAPNKAYTAARERQPSGNLGKWAQETGKDMGYWTDAKFTGLGGGVPIEYQGRVVGAVGISGMSEADDEALARLAISHVFHA